jgi:hypothetical protein
VKIVSLTVCRNEDWIIGLSLRAALKWVDASVVLVHSSKDRTLDIVKEVAALHLGKVEILIEENPVWMEMDVRQRMLDKGREMGGDTFAIIDSDEVPTANVLDRMRGWCGELSPGQLLDLPMIPVWNGLEYYRCDRDGVWCKSYITAAFRDAPGLCWKPKDDGYQYHNRPPYGCGLKWEDRKVPLPRHSEGGVMHLQFASLKRLYAKHAHYKMEEATRWKGREANAVIDQKYSIMTRKSGLTLRGIPKGWWAGYDRSLVSLDADPWHIEECKRMWKVHGPEAFRNLDLFGVAP